MSKLIFMLLLVFVAPAITFAQNFTYKAKVAPAPKDGFYKILLSSELNAFASAHHDDLRMMDNDGKEIPFLLKKEDQYQTQSDFVNYGILEDNSEGDWQAIVIANANKDKIDKFIFEMKNAETDRVVRISGSNDRGKWYVVRDRFYFISMGTGADATVRQQITFPVSDYLYFKVEIRMKDKQALNIEQVGYSSQEYKAPAYLRVNGVSFKRTDSNKSTRLHFSCLPLNRIDKLVFHISSPAMFKRSGIVKKMLAVEEYSADGHTNLSMSSKKYRSEYTPEESFELNSEDRRFIETSSYLGYDKTSDFLIEINNYDNEALKIDSVTAYQLSSTLTAELKKDKSYFLYFGDSLLHAPSYDLVYFQNKIPADAATLSIGEVQPKSAVVKEEYSKSNDKMMVWIGLGIIAVILFFLTGSMVKKMGKE